MGLEELTGKTFNNLTVLSRNLEKKGQRFWNCQCSCGNQRIVSTTSLIRNLIISCGCLNFLKEHRNKKYTPQEASYRSKVCNLISHAKNKGYGWNLSFDYALELIKKDCLYCGNPPSQPHNVVSAKRAKNSRMTAKQADYQIVTNGIDRINSNLGYIIGNVNPCCWICNRAKSDLSLDDFENWINNLIKFRNNI